METAPLLTLADNNQFKSSLIIGRNRSFPRLKLKILKLIIYSNSTIFIQRFWS